MSLSRKRDFCLQCIEHQILLILFYFLVQTVGDINLARRCLRLCLSLDVFSGSALNNLGVIATQMKQMNKAKSYFAAAKTVLPDTYEVLHNTNKINSID